MIAKSARGLGLALAFIALCSGCREDEGVTNPPLPEGPYAGAAACKPCHEQIYIDYLTTGHAQQIQRVTGSMPPTYHWAAAIPHPVTDPPGDLTWNDISLVLGGHFGFAVYFTGEGRLISGPASFWNIGAGAWGTFDPGQPEPYDCAACHMSGFDPDGSQSEFPALVGSWEQDGVTCEGCHGPGRDHILSEDPNDIDVDTSEGFCLRCHGQVPNHPLSGFGGVDLGVSHVGSCSWCHDPHVSFKYEFERSLWRDCADCHQPTQGTERPQLSPFHGHGMH